MIVQGGCALALASLASSSAGARGLINYTARRLLALRLAMRAPAVMVSVPAERCDSLIWCIRYSS